MGGARVTNSIRRIIHFAARAEPLPTTLSIATTQHRRDSFTQSCERFSTLCLSLANWLNYTSVSVRAGKRMEESRNLRAP
jgi:hypothetical protein